MLSTTFRDRALAPDHEHKESIRRAVHKSESPSQSVVAMRGERVFGWVREREKKKTTDTLVAAAITSSSPSSPPLVEPGHVGPFRSDL